MTEKLHQKARESQASRATSGTLECNPSAMVESVTRVQGDWSMSLVWDVPSLETWTAFRDQHPAGTDTCRCGVQKKLWTGHMPLEVTNSGPRGKPCACNWTLSWIFGLRC